MSNFSFSTEEIKIFIICGPCGVDYPYGGRIDLFEDTISTLKSLKLRNCECGACDWKMLSEVDYLSINRDRKIKNITE